MDVRLGRNLVFLELEVEVWMISSDMFWNRTRSHSDLHVILPRRSTEENAVSLDALGLRGGRWNYFRIDLRRYIFFALTRCMMTFRDPTLAFAMKWFSNTPISCADSRHVPDCVPAFHAQRKAPRLCPGQLHPLQPFWLNYGVQIFLHEWDGWSDSGLSIFEYASV